MWHVTIFNIFYIIPMSLSLINWQIPVRQSFFYLFSLHHQLHLSYPWNSILIFHCLNTLECFIAHKQVVVPHFGTLKRNILSISRNLVLISLCNLNQHFNSKKKQNNYNNNSFQSIQWTMVLFQPTIAFQKTD